jgi:hypothetical protein
MKYSHAIIGVVTSISGMVVLGEIGVMPYSFSMPVVLLIAGVAVFYWKSPKWLQNKTVNMSYGNGDYAVNPSNALEWLQNEKIPATPGYKKLDLDKTSTNNMRLHTEHLNVWENGEKQPAFGVVGAPLNQQDKEAIGYVVHCKTGKVDYNGQLHSAESRLSPIQQGKQWLINKGVNAQVKDQQSQPESQGSVNIYQGQNHRNTENKGESVDG